MEREVRLDQADGSRGASHVGATQGEQILPSERRIWMHNGEVKKGTSVRLEKTIDKSWTNHQSKGISKKASSGWKKPLTNHSASARATST